MFIPEFSTIAAPITRLFGKDVPFEWMQNCVEAMCKIKKRITASPVLVQPNPSKQFELEVDASQIATGAILYQRGPPTMRPDGTEKTWCKTPSGIPLPKVQLNGTKLPNLRQGVPGHHARP